MKYIKYINKFILIKESVDVYDYGRKNGNLEMYFRETQKLSIKFTSEEISEIQTRLPNFKFIPQECDGYHYLYAEFVGFFTSYWVIHYYGDYCYGVFQWDTNMAFHQELTWVEFCDTLEPVIKRMLRNQKLISGE